MAALALLALALCVAESAGCGGAAVARPAPTPERAIAMAQLATACLGFVFVVPALSSAFIAWHASTVLRGKTPPRAATMVPFFCLSPIEIIAGALLLLVYANGYPAFKFERVFNEGLPAPGLAGGLSMPITFQVKDPCAGWTAENACPDAPGGHDRVTSPGLGSCPNGTGYYDTIGLFFLCTSLPAVIVACANCMWSEYNARVAEKLEEEAGKPEQPHAEEPLMRAS